MDVKSLFESREESDEGESPSTTAHSKDSSQCLKRRTIRKNYEIIVEGGVTYRYEDDPQEYRRIRKKIQNRESATRTRYRKKDAHVSLQYEVEELRRLNNELSLENARLHTENKALKEQTEYLKGLVGHRQPLQQQRNSIEIEGQNSTSDLSRFLEVNDDAQSTWSIDFSATSSKLLHSYWLPTLILCISVMLIAQDAGNVSLARQVGMSSIEGQSGPIDLLERIGHWIGWLGAFPLRTYSHYALTLVGIMLLFSAKKNKARLIKRQ